MKNYTLILGFFDGIHLGHRKVIKSAVEFCAKNNSEPVLLTFCESPAEYFNKKSKYIYSRSKNYQIINSLGVINIIEEPFSTLVDIKAENYLKKIINEYNPNAIFTGFNYTFGSKRTGNPEFLESNQAKYNYKYFCINPIMIDNIVVSSTIIKQKITEGNLAEANTMLGQNFSIISEVIKGAQIGRTLGFPTANMKYPSNIIELPFGVYKVSALEKPAILNWGVKPTLNGIEPVLEVHIPNFAGDLYGKNLEISIIKRIRSEKKFNSLEELKAQIEKDTKACLK